MPYVVLTLVASLAGVIYWGLSNYKQVALLEDQLKTSRIMIDAQNEAIETLRLNTEQYKKDIQEFDEIVENKYNKVISTTTENSSCETKLKEIESLLTEFSK